MMPALADAREVVGEARSAGLRPEPLLTVSEWADRYRVLDASTSSEPGPWRTSRVPYLGEIQDKMSPRDPTHRIVVMKGSQVGLSEAGLNMMGYLIHHAPGPVLYVWPTIDLAQRVSKDRVSKLISNCPVLAERVSEPRSRDGNNTILMKQFPGGSLVLAGSNSAAGLRMMAARYLIFDEVDGFAHDAGGEGDPIELAEARSATFKRNRKIVMWSTPTTDGISRIQAAYQESDRRVYLVPCPHCNHEQQILFDNLKWEKDSAGNHRPETAALQCTGCGDRIEERHKTWMLANGRWQPTAVSDVAGYHISSLYSPLGWYSWSEAARDFLKAKKHPERLKTFVNTKLGEVWIEDHEAGDPDVLAQRREAYCPSEGDPLPEKVLVLTAGVDVQDDRLELEVMGWGREHESWGIEHRVFRCPPGTTPGQRDVWDQLAVSLGKTWKRADGAQLRLAATCIDTGGHYTESVYRFCRAFRRLNVFAIKGVGGMGRPIVGRPSKNNRIKLPLWPIGVDTAKDLVYSRLKVSEFGPGYCHFPRDYDEEWFKQICGERRMTITRKGFKRSEWHKIRANEAFDLRVYGTAALILRGIDVNAVADRQESMRETPVNATETPQIQRKKQPKRLKRRGGWVSGMDL